MTSLPHALVVGGTGMLSDALLALVARGYRVSTIARTSSTLTRLQRTTTSMKGELLPLSLDYCDGDSLQKTLLTQKNMYGPFELALVWIHQTAPQAPYIVAEHIGCGANKGHYFHVLGSSQSQPGLDPKPRRRSFQAYPQIHYHEILLGFRIERGHSRWLTHEEIAQGTLQAIQEQAPSFLIGQVTPWSKRP